MTTTVQRPAARSLAAVELAGVEKRFGAVTAVAGITVRIEPGEVVALLGPNGAGKTTTIDMMLGLSRPTAGELSVYGRPPADAVALGLVTAVMQTGGLLGDLTVEETVRLVGSLFGRARPVGEVLQRAGIAGIRARRVRACSGGEKQRLRFALALLPDPELLILDEPTTGMDVAGRHDFWTAIRADARRGRTVIFATHYLEEADAYADRVILVHRGRIVADGTAAQVRALASGRMLRATLPDGVPVAALRGLAGPDSVEVRGETVYVRTDATDDVARYLLTRTAARDVEITSSNLEQAFLTLTSDGSPR